MLKAACILLFIGLAASESSVSSVVSRLLDQAKSSSNNRPVILILNSKALQESSSVEAPRQSSEEGGLSMLNMLLGQIQKSRAKPALDRYRARPDRLPASSNRNKKRLPVYKSLLSLRNSLRCGAQNECKDECSELPKKQEKKCTKKCEMKFECEVNCDDDECGDGSGSTKAPPASEEKQESCSRC